jgi:Flp pilus assembly protein TadG
MVEAAIVTPVLAAMLFGIIELGMLFKDYLGTQAMIQAGVRVGSASPRTVDFAQAAADRMQRTGTAVSPSDVVELWVYKANSADDFPAGATSFADCTVCVKFGWDAGAQRFVPTHDGWSWSDQNACTASAGGPPDRIGVYAKVRHDAITGVMGPTTISEATAMHLEPFPALSGCRP